MNHLIASKQINIKKLENIIDYPSSNEESIFSKVHIHVYHNNDMFSKFMFKAGKYDNMTISSNLNDTKLVKYYCLNIALDSKRRNRLELNQMLQKVISNKT